MCRFTHELRDDDAQDDDDDSVQNDAHIEYDTDEYHGYADYESDS